MNEKYVNTLEEILDNYAENCKTSIDVVIDSCVSVIKTFKEVSLSRYIIETEVAKMHEMINYLVHNYVEKSNHVGVVALDLNLITTENHYINMYDYSKKKLETVQESEFEGTNIDVRIDEF